MVYFTEAYRIFELKLKEEKLFSLDVISKMSNVVSKYNAEFLFENNKCFIKVPENVSFNNIKDEVIDELFKLGYK